MPLPGIDYWLLAVLAALLAIALLGWLWLRRESPQAQLQRAQKLFAQQRSGLQALFFQAAAASGKPRGLRWKECQWEDAIEWLRDKQTGQLLALVGVVIAFEAIEGSDMEGVAAVGNLRIASAVFFWQNGQWKTAGRTIFNLAPADAVQHFQQGYERVASNEGR